MSGGNDPDISLCLPLKCRTDTKIIHFTHLHQLSDDWFEKIDTAREVCKYLL